jgi:hypothetical protein
MNQAPKKPALRLFALRDIKTGKIGTEFFSDKQRAKAARDENSRVTYGPDHRLFKRTH